MADFVARKRPPRVVLLTECSMSDNVALQYPKLEFVRPCNLCPHMKRITLPEDPPGAPPRERGTPSSV